MRYDWRPLPTLNHVFQVDDDDRDFRRSKRHGSDGDGDQSQRPTASLSSNRGDNAFAGKKRRNDDTGTRY